MLTVGVGMLRWRWGEGAVGEEPRECLPPAWLSEAMGAEGLVRERSVPRNALWLRWVRIVMSAGGNVPGRALEGGTGVGRYAGVGVRVRRCMRHSLPSCVREREVPRHGECAK